MFRYVSRSSVSLVAGVATEGSAATTEHKGHRCVQSLAFWLCTSGPSARPRRAAASLKQPIDTVSKLILFQISHLMRNTPVQHSRYPTAGKFPAAAKTFTASSQISIESVCVTLVVPRGRISGFRWT